MTIDGESDTVEDFRLPPMGPGPARVPVRVDVGARTHPGKARPLNEDNFHVVRFGRYLRTLLSSLPAGYAPEEADRPGYGFAVADGVGGRAGGEVASRMAISLLVGYALDTPDWLLGRDEELLARALDRSAQRFRAVNEAVLAEAQATPGLEGMAATLSVAVTLEDHLLVTHLGDSRVYLHRQGRLHRLTRDHTVGQLVTDPDTTSAARFRRALTHAIGLPATGGDPDLYHYRLADGDRLLLCTDGLTDVADEDAIAGALGRAPSADDACRALVELALDRGGPDNITAVVAAYQF